MKKVVHKTDNENEWLLLSEGFRTKFRLVFVLTLENAFFRSLILKPTKRA